MSLVQNPLIGRAKQKLGNTVFTTWKGKNVLKSKPITVENPKTPAQLMRRSALSGIVSFYRLIAGVVSVGFKELANGMSEYNAFTSGALKDAFDYSAPPVATFQPQNLKISKGTIATQAITSISNNLGTNKIRVDWDSSSLQPGQSATDKALIVIQNKRTGENKSYVTDTNRSANFASVDCTDDTLEDDEMLFWLGFYNPTTHKAADSQFSSYAITA